MIAVQLIAHGSRREEANADLLKVAEQLRAGRPLKKGSDPLEGVEEQGKAGRPERVRPLFQRTAGTDYEIVVASYLELAEPSIPDAARQCVEAGATEVLLMPYFLSAGSHVTSDLQRFRDELNAEFLDVTFRLCPPLGLHPLMLEIVCDRLTEAEEQ